MSGKRRRTSAKRTRTRRAVVARTPAHRRFVDDVVARGVPVALAAACVTFAAAAMLLQRLTLGPAALGATVVVALALTLSLMPRGHGARPTGPAPRWDIPARMIITTALVVAITGAAATLGPRL